MSGTVSSNISKILLLRKYMSNNNLQSQQLLLLGPSVDILTVLWPPYTVCNEGEVEVPGMNE